MQKYVFNCQKQVLYNEVSKMLIDNANQFAQELAYDVDLKEVSYTYGTNSLTTVKVTEYKEFDFILYQTHQFNRETYLVSFNFEELKNSTRLNYNIALVTESKKEKYNYMIMNILYYFSNKKKFKAMCHYLQSKIN